MGISDKDLNHIVVNALNLEEHLKLISQESSLPIEDTLIEKRMESWCQSAAGGDKEAFDKLLLLRNSDLSILLKALGNISNFPFSDYPFWAKTLQGILHRLEIIKDIPLSPCRSLPGVAFQEVFTPFIDDAKYLLAKECSEPLKLISDKALDGILHNLLEQLSDISSRTLYSEFSVYRASNRTSFSSLLCRKEGIVSKELYDEFISQILDDNLISFFKEYPVLARLLATLTYQWVEFIKDFLNRLKSDINIISETFNNSEKPGKVDKIHCRLSDSHNGGRTVVLLEFEKGLKIVFKPRNTDLEEAYYSLCKWLNQNGCPQYFKALKIVNLKTYGWMEYAEHSSCENEIEVKKYYKRAGALLALSYALELGDLHRQNLIASGEYPVIVDLETLMQQRLRELYITEKEPGGLSFEEYHSILYTGLLPIPSKSKDESYIDICGLTGGLDLTKQFKTYRWKNINTDEMAYVYEPAEASRTSNIPLLGSTPCFPRHYLEEISYGFTQMYLFMVETKHRLALENILKEKFKGLRCRFVFRSTGTYGDLLSNSIKPQYLRSGIERSIVLERVFDIIYSFKLYAPIYRLAVQELISLELLDIPYFFYISDSSALESPSCCIEKNFFSSTALQNVLDKIKGLNKEDLNKQLEFLYKSLE